MGGDLSAALKEFHDYDDAVAPQYDFESRCAQQEVRR
jgi:hypothetical protein